MNGSIFLSPPFKDDVPPGFEKSFLFVLYLRNFHSVATGKVKRSLIAFFMLPSSFFFFRSSGELFFIIFSSSKVTKKNLTGAALSSIFRDVPTPKSSIIWCHTEESIGDGLASIASSRTSKKGCCAHERG